MAIIKTYDQKEKEDRKYKESKKSFVTSTGAAQYMPPRTGKTLKDHKSGAHARRLENRQRRVDWSNDPRRTAKSFPLSACNGKKSKSLKAK